MNQVRSSRLCRFFAEALGIFSSGKALSLRCPGLLSKKGMFYRNSLSSEHDFLSSATSFTLIKGPNSPFFKQVLQRHPPFFFLFQDAFSFFIPIPVLLVLFFSWLKGSNAHFGPSCVVFFVQAAVVFVVPTLLLQPGASLFFERFFFHDFAAFFSFPSGASPVRDSSRFWTQLFLFSWAAAFFPVPLFYLARLFSKV